MIYRCYDDEADFDRIVAYYLSNDSKEKECRNAISKVDETGYWTMCFEEEFE